MIFSRASGILLHPTSLPGDFGIGDLGSEAFKFIDFLVESSQSYWQILPLGPTGYGDSPYQCFSAFAGNTLLISPEKLVEDALVSASEIEDHPEFTDHKVNYGEVNDWKNQLLSRAYHGFHHVTSVDLRGKFETFCQENESWLDDYALYRSIKGSQGQNAWYRWPVALKRRERKSPASCWRAVIRTNAGRKILSISFLSPVVGCKGIRRSQGR